MMGLNCDQVEHTIGATRYVGVLREGFELTHSGYERDSRGGIRTHEQLPHWAADAPAHRLLLVSFNPRAPSTNSMA